MANGSFPSYDFHYQYTLERKSRFFPFSDMGMGNPLKQVFYPRSLGMPAAYRNPFTVMQYLPEIHVAIFLYFSWSVFNLLFTGIMAHKNLTCFSKPTV